MKIIISPAKSLDFENKANTDLYTQPRFLEQSEKLNKKLKTLSRKKLGELMKISDDLSNLNYERNQNWQPPFALDNAKQAIFSFTGEVFRGIDVTTIAEDKLPEMQDKLRILSGLYGLLKPLDLIQPYRLEMGTKLKVGRKNNLYEFWGDSVTNKLNEELTEDDIFINLASNIFNRFKKHSIMKKFIFFPLFLCFSSFTNAQSSQSIGLNTSYFGHIVQDIIGWEAELAPEMGIVYNYFLDKKHGIVSGISVNQMKREFGLQSPNQPLLFSVPHGRKMRWRPEFSYLYPSCAGCSLPQLSLLISHTCDARLVPSGLTLSVCPMRSNPK